MSPAGPRCWWDPPRVAARPHRSPGLVSVGLGGTRRARPDPRAFPSRVRGWQGSALSPCAQARSHGAGPGNPCSGLCLQQQQNRAVCGERGSAGWSRRCLSAALPVRPCCCCPRAPRAAGSAPGWPPEPPAPRPCAPGAGPRTAGMSAPAPGGGRGPSSGPQPWGGEQVTEVSPTYAHSHKKPTAEAGQARLVFFQLLF